MSFQNTAKEVVRNSIRSAICIDDEYGSAYSNPDTGLKLEEPSKLYYSFREDGHCDLDIYNFRNLKESWNKDYMVENKDLMVLDWELDPSGQHDSTIEILNDVIKFRKIPFILIYTNTEDLDSVSKSICRKFCPYSKVTRKTVFEEIEKQFGYVSESEFDIDEVIESHEELSFEMIHHFENREDIQKDFEMKINGELNVKEEHQDKTINKLKAIASNKLGSLDGKEILNINQLFLSDHSEYYEYTIERINHKVPSYRINGTIVMIFHKGSQDGGILPENLFTSFSDLLISDPNNFLSILSLELKDTLRQEFSSIGSSFSNIREESFFYHINNYRNSNGKLDLDRIYDFVLSSWISELYSQRINKGSRILGYSNEFIENFKDSFDPNNNEHLLGGLLKYSLFVTSTDLKQRTDKSLRFGDTFGVKDQKELFFMCITPHCDLINPKDKVNDNLYFIKGRIQKDEVKALEDVDSEFYSFAKMDNKVVAIKWICKPITFYLPDANIDQIKINYTGKDYNLVHLSLVKENIAQRIANQSFGYGYRVGIDVPYIPKNEEELQ